MRRVNFTLVVTSTHRLAEQIPLAVAQGGTQDSIARQTGQRDEVFTPKVNAFDRVVVGTSVQARVGNKPGAASRMIDKV